MAGPYKMIFRDRWGWSAVKNGFSRAGNVPASEKCIFAAKTKVQSPPLKTYFTIPTNSFRSSVILGYRILRHKTVPF